MRHEVFTARDGGQELDLNGRVHESVTTGGGGQELALLPCLPVVLSPVFLRFQVGGISNPDCPVGCFNDFSAALFQLLD